MTTWRAVAVEDLGRDDEGEAVGVEADGPAFGVVDIPRSIPRGFDLAVVVRAQQHQVPQFRGAERPPRLDVVGLAVLGRMRTPGEHAAFVAGHERGPDLGGDEPLRRADLHRDAFAVQHDRQDVGITGQAAEFGGGEVFPA